MTTRIIQRGYGIRCWTEDEHGKGFWNIMNCDNCGLAAPGSGTATK